MKFISWNVAGIRAVLKKQNIDFLLETDVDVVCFQETKALPEQVSGELYDKLKEKFPYQYWNYPKEKKGYSGTAIWSKKKADVVVKDNPFLNQVDQEGRIIAAYFGDICIINVYTPNSKADLSRLDYRVNTWDLQFRNYVNSLKERNGGNIIVCGDLNVAYKNIDIHNPKNREHLAGFTLDERESFGNLISIGFTDSLRLFHMHDNTKFTYWPYVQKTARYKNHGWRIDYFLCSTDMIQALKSSEVLNQIYGSDHCPISLEI
tara:strand:+ start:2697 stop:3482 length:786 start_codon:yes stop_codon:yes gene_type:complete